MAGVRMGLAIYALLAASVLFTPRVVIQVIETALRVSRGPHEEEQGVTGQSVVASGCLWRWRMIVDKIWFSSGLLVAAVG
jgi:hypothetical protein